MKITWIKGLNDQQKEEMQREFVASAHLRNRLTQMLKEKQETSYKESIKKDFGPNWAYMQADARGFERALEEVMSLLENKV